LPACQQPARREIGICPTPLCDAVPWKRTQPEGEGYSCHTASSVSSCSSHLSIVSAALLRYKGCAASSDLSFNSSPALHTADSHQHQTRKTKPRVPRRSKSLTSRRLCVAAGRYGGSLLYRFYSTFFLDARTYIGLPHRSLHQGMVYLIFPCIFLGKKMESGFLVWVH
jgi:hypothetical protein